MKNFVALAAVVLVLLAFSGMAFSEHKMETQTQMIIGLAKGGEYTGVSSGTSAGGSSADYYDLKNFDGFCSVQVAIAGSGTLSMTYQTSNDGVTFSEPLGASDIMSSKTATSDEDGNMIDQFTVEMGRYMLFEFKETGGASALTVTCTPALK